MKSLEHHMDFRKNKLSINTDLPKQRPKTAKASSKLDDEVSNDLLGASPDVRRFDKKKNVIMEYMRKAMMQKLGKSFSINP
jgi:hypothetical protein